MVEKHGSKEPEKVLSLFDSTCILVGIVIGAGIYEVTPIVAASLPGWKSIIGVWLLGGMLALAGALSYAELAAAYPYEGGDYVYQTRAYGRWAGFSFGWSQLVIVRPGDIALMAFVFARYATTLYAPFPNMKMFYATVAVALLTLINIMGVRGGKWTQNLLTSVKVAGLLLVVAGGLLAPVPAAHSVANSHFQGGGFGLALILVLFTFGGWNEMAYVAAEVKDPKRNIVRSLAIGVVLVTAVYVLVNASFLHALGGTGMASSNAIAVDATSGLFQGASDKIIGIIICVSALGAVNGLIFTGARISYAMGSEHRLFKPIGRWSSRLGTPSRALVFQGATSLAIILFAGSFIDTILYTAPVVWLFFLATGISLFVLRRKECGVVRPYHVAFFPFTPILFSLCCAFMLYASVSYAVTERSTGFLVVLAVFMAGLLVYRFTEGSNWGNPDG